MTTAAVASGEHPPWTTAGTATTACVMVAGTHEAAGVDQTPGPRRLPLWLSLPDSRPRPSRWWWRSPSGWCSASLSRCGRHVELMGPVAVKRSVQVAVHVLPARLWFCVGFVYGVGRMGQGGHMQQQQQQ